MGASIRGFRGSMRPVVAVDGTFLKGKYLGTLFVAVCHDGQNQIYPLAFGVGDSENDASWTWFLTKLRSAIGEVADLVFVSDRHGSIGKAVQTVFPEAYHGACMYHVAGNMRNKFGDDETMFKLYYTAAKAYLVSEFNSVMTDIWAIKDGKVSSINHYALQVHEADLYHIVDLNAKSCMCRRFDLDQLPCVHATAACRIRNTSVYTMCSKFYTANAIVLAYAEPIWSVGNKSEWSVPEEVHNRVVLPPIRQVVSGRRKTNRIPSQGEERIVQKCSRCGGTGHNRQTCKNPIRLNSNT
ncbi:unnamed protein product [Malus baccata var. baccata]